MPVAPVDETAGEVRATLAGSRFDSVAAVAVLDDGRLAGLLTLEAWLAAGPRVPVGAIMDREPPVLTPGASQERVAWAMVAAMAATVLVGAYEAQREAKVLLAFFVPGVVDMADAVGTQTEALLMRGLSAGSHSPTCCRSRIYVAIASWIAL